MKNTLIVIPKYGDNVTFYFERAGQATTILAKMHEAAKNQAQASQYVEEEIAQRKPNVDYVIQTLSKELVHEQAKSKDLAEKLEQREKELKVLQEKVEETNKGLQRRSKQFVGHFL